MRLDGEDFSVGSDCSRERHAILALPRAHVDDDTACHRSISKKPKVLRFGQDVLKLARPSLDGVSVVVETQRVGKDVSTKPMHPHSLPVLDQRAGYRSPSPLGREEAQNRASGSPVQGMHEISTYRQGVFALL